MKYTIDKISEISKNGDRYVNVRYTCRELMYSGIIDLPAKEATKDTIKQRIEAQLINIQEIKKLKGE